MPRHACHSTPTQVFFAENTGPARAVCARCEVTADCLAVALADPKLEGVWGGTSDADRRRMRRQARQGVPLREAMDRAGFSQQGLADACGVHHSIIARWVNGERSPRPSSRAAAERALGCRVAWHTEVVAGV